MTPGRYTELFFLDEATALAAGHRPCAECQRERFSHFRGIWTNANPEANNMCRPAATALDAVLHNERTATSKHSREFCNSVENLPDGTFVTDDERNAFLVLRKQLLQWSPAGYHRPASAVSVPVRVLTPASVVRTISAGYEVGIHRSALQAIG
jgi:hypothetical protein